MPPQLLIGVPNALWIFGTTCFNASWTLRVDMAAAAMCRLIREADRMGRASFVAVAPPDVAAGASDPELLSSGYIQRSRHLFPHTAPFPFNLSQSFLADKLDDFLRPGPLNDVLFGGPGLDAVPQRQRRQPGLTLCAICIAALVPAGAFLAMRSRL